MQKEIERRLTRTEAAAFLTERGYRVAYATLNKYATVGGGPVFESFGRRPLYKPTDLLAWVASKTTPPRRHTSEQV
ncbi:DNA-binding protein [uncultured Reyranella sp.]|uniref:DNA-binding protein n=1 Tax=uncultured Reyranella sp. TaxID=735512 RepID=UPI0025FD9374|nr:DNA-binding protein [uncultured Reyranella sp.]